MRLFAFAAALLAAPAALAGPLSSYRDQSRLVVASAPRANDPSLARQRALFAALGRRAKARDLVLVEAVGDDPRSLAIRKALGLGARDFEAALVGKDGEVKLKRAAPLDAATLLPLIDAMPMRRQEWRERGE